MPIASEEMEVIVVNDGSKDNTEEVIRDWREKVTNLKAIHHITNKGPAATRNSGAKNASGKVLLFLDNDIIMTPDILKMHLSYFDEDRNDNTIILSQIYNFRPSTKESVYAYLNEMEVLNENDLKKYKTEEIDPYFDIRQEILNSGNMDSEAAWIFGALFCSTMYKSTFEKIGGFDENFVGWGPEDIEFAYRAQKAGCKFVYKDTAVCFHLDFEKKDKDVFIKSVQRNAKYLYLKHSNKDIKNYLRFYKGDISFEEFNSLLKGAPFDPKQHQKLHYLGILKFLFKKSE